MSKSPKVNGKLHKKQVNGENGEWGAKTRRKTDKGYEHRGRRAVGSAEKRDKNKQRQRDYCQPETPSGLSWPPWSASHCSTFVYTHTHTYTNTKTHTHTQSSVVCISIIKCDQRYCPRANIHSTVITPVGRHAHTHPPTHTATLFCN